MKNSELLEAFFDLVKLEAGAIPVAYPGCTFRVPESGNWLEVRHFPNDIDPTLADATSYRRGIFQIDVHNQPNTGVIQLYQLAEALADAFPKGFIIGGTVTVSRTPDILQFTGEPDRITAAVSIEYAQ